MPRVSGTEIPRNPRSGYRRSHAAREETRSAGGHQNESREGMNPVWKWLVLLGLLATKEGRALTILAGMVYLWFKWKKR